MNTTLNRAFFKVFFRGLNRAFFKVLITTLNQTLENANRLIILNIILNFRHFRLSHILVEQRTLIEQIREETLLGDQKIVIGDPEDGDSKEDQNKKAITIIKDALIGYKIFCTGSLSTLSVNFLKRKWKLK